MAEAWVHFGEGNEPRQTVKVEVRAKLDGPDDQSVYRLKVPGFGWRTLRYATLRERLAGQPKDYVRLTGEDRAAVTLQI